MKKFKKHKVVYVPPKKGEYEENVCLVMVKNVYVLTEIELRDLFMQWEFSSFKNFDEFIKQNIK